MRREAKDTCLPVSEFKKRCLSLLEEVRREGRELVITKRGEPIARVVPLAPPSQTLRGTWKGLFEIAGDIVHTDWSDDWEASR